MFHFMSHCRRCGAYVQGIYLIVALNHVLRLSSVVCRSVHNFCPSTIKVHFVMDTEILRNTTAVSELDLVLRAYIEQIALALYMNFPNDVVIFQNAKMVSMIRLRQVRF